MDKSDELRRKYVAMVALRDSQKRKLDQYKDEHSQFKRKAIRLEQARDSIHIVAKNTQEILEYNLNSIVSEAMETVFDDPYEVKIEFVVKRNKTEADIHFVRRGMKYEPLTSSGGGTIDVSAFAIKLALWSLKAKKTRKCLIFDEPFKNVNDPSRTLHQRLSEMVSNICEDLGVQIIMVSLEEEMIDNCDRSVHITKKDDESQAVVKDAL
jgi:DNA repair exonuclease SbcCD ATPase subunit